MWVWIVNSLDGIIGVDLIAIWLKVYVGKMVDVELCLMINERWVGWWYFGVIYVMFGVIVGCLGWKKEENDQIDERNLRCWRVKI